MWTSNKEDEGKMTSSLENVSQKGHLSLFEKTGAYTKIAANEAEEKLQTYVADFLTASEACEAVV